MVDMEKFNALRVHLRSVLDEYFWFRSCAYFPPGVPDPREIPVEELRKQFSVREDGVMSLAIPKRKEECK